MRLFEYSEESLLATIPTMLAFPNLNDVYAAWKDRLESRQAHVRLKTEVTQVVERKNGRIVLKCKRAEDESGESETLAFDELILATDADSSLKILGKEASWMERKVLGNVKYFYDVSITHHDREYMKQVRHRFF